MTPHELSWDATWNDLAAFGMHLSRRRIRFLRVVCVVGILFALRGLLAATYAGFIYMLFFAVCLVSSIMLLVFTQHFIKRAMIRNVRASGAQPGRVNLRVTDVGVERSFGRILTTVPFEAFAEIVETPDYVFLTGPAPVVVPRRALTNRMILQELKTRIGAAKGRVS